MTFFLKPSLLPFYDVFLKVEPLLVQHFATVCASFVFSWCLWVTQLSSKSQPDGWRETKGGRQTECVSVPPSLCLWRCPAASPAQRAWSFLAAAASFPGNEPYLGQALLYSDLDGKDGGRCDIFKFKHSLHPENNSFLLLCLLY